MFDFFERCFNFIQIQPQFFAAETFNRKFYSNFLKLSVSSPRHFLFAVPLHGTI